MLDWLKNPARVLGVAWLLPVFLFSHTPSSEIERGISLFGQHHYHQSFALLKPYADKGDANASLYIGLLYDMGSTDLMDKSLAVVWYRKAADRGNAQAQYDLGVMYSKGEGITKNLPQAITWYRKAAQQAYAPAAYNLGVIYERGYGIARNVQTARRWYHRAATRGSAKAAYNLATLYYRGTLFPQDIPKALRYYHQAATMGHTQAMYMLGYLYATRSLGVEQNLTLSEKWYTEAAINGHKASRKKLLKLLEKLGKKTQADFWRRHIK